MEIPECLAREADHRIGEGAEDVLGGAGDVEISLGQIVSIVEERRICFDTPHAVIFNSMPAECRFDSGISFEAHSRALGCFRGSSVQVTSDTISFYNTTRKISTEGRMPVYQRKDRRAVCYVHIPVCGYDARVSVCTVREVENPDRRPQNYTFPKQRETHSLSAGGCIFSLVRVADLGKSIDKNTLASAQNHRLLTYHAEAVIPGGRGATESLFSVLCRFVSGGFVRERNGR